MRVLPVGGSHVITERLDAMVGKPLNLLPIKVNEEKEKQWIQN
jgi:hypothetical protein